jgi:pantoate--beta-alanine ligase
MKIYNTIQFMRTASRAARAAGKRVGIVPTMGALHEGHLSLVKAAKAQSDFVAVSIFVNPTQFGPNEDFAKYPRSFERDCRLLEDEGVDAVFAPSVEEMYPGGAMTSVTVQGLSEKLCGRSRPGHFQGVATVVSKLFHIVEPDHGFFGQKDAAQVAVIRRMVRDLDLPVEIMVCPIVREPDGLALSSRNAYLDAEQRKTALVLSQSLREVERVFHSGERDAGRLVEAGKELFRATPKARLDYLEIVEPNTLDPVQQIEKSSLVAVAAFVGATRLIDNILLS